MQGTIHLSIKTCNREGQCETWNDLTSFLMQKETKKNISLVLLLFIPEKVKIIDEMRPEKTDSPLVSTDHIFAISL